MKKQIPVRILTDEEIREEQNKKRIKELRKQLELIGKQSDRNLGLFFKACCIISILLIIMLGILVYNIDDNITPTKTSAGDIKNNIDECVKQCYKPKPKVVKKRHEINDCIETEENICVYGESIPRYVSKKGVSDGRIQRRVNYAYHVGGKDFMLTLEAENGLWQLGRLSNRIGANGHYDKGLCQLNYQWHKPFIQSKEFKDAYKQIDYCLGVYKDGIKRGRIRTTFYGYNNRWKVKNNFEYLD